MVQPSHIRKAGEGVVNHSSTIPLGVLFGPYPGEFIPLKYRQKAWEIINPESGDLIDFVDPGSAEDNSYPTAGWPRSTAPRRPPLRIWSGFIITIGYEMNCWEWERSVQEGVLGQGTGVTRGVSSSLKLSSCSSFVLIAGNLNSSGLAVVPGMTKKIFHRPPLPLLPQSSGAERNRVIKTKKRTVPVENIFVTISQISYFIFK